MSKRQSFGCCCRIRDSGAADHPPAGLVCGGTKYSLATAGHSLSTHAAARPGSEISSSLIILPAQGLADT
jgi:hypothetical protein